MRTPLNTQTQLIVPELKDAETISYPAISLPSSSKQKAPLKSLSNPSQALAHLEKHNAKLASLPADKRKEIEERERWAKAEERAKGGKVADQEGTLKKAVKRLEKKKSKSGKEWYVVFWGLFLVLISLTPKGGAKAGPGKVARGRRQEAKRQHCQPQRGSKEQEDGRQGEEQGEDQGQGSTWLRGWEEGRQGGQQRRSWRRQGPGSEPRQGQVGTETLREWTACIGRMTCMYTGFGRRET